MALLTAVIPPSEGELIHLILSEDDVAEQLGICLSTMCGEYQVCWQAGVSDLNTRAYRLMKPIIGKVRPNVYGKTALVGITFDQAWQLVSAAAEGES
jgi:hypothetical protein